MPLRPLVLAPVLLAAVLAGCGSSGSAVATGAGSPGVPVPSASALPGAPSGAAPTPSAASAAPVTVAGTGRTTATLAVGQRLVVTTAAGDVGTPRDAAVLVAADGGYRAVSAGTTTVSIERRPHCPAGQLCSQLVQLVGTVTVTVR